jgi:hypothetical protein
LQAARLWNAHEAPLLSGQIVEMNLLFFAIAGDKTFAFRKFAPD